MNTEYINIFVYGTLKKGYPNHDAFCRNATRIIPYKIKGTMYDTKMGFPAIQLKGNYDIYGQIITVPLEDLPNFDYLQGVPSFYQRQTIEITIDNKREKAYVYTMRILPFNSTIMKIGNW